jgi:hypothetical protein
MVGLFHLPHKIRSKTQSEKRERERERERERKREKEKGEKEAEKRQPQRELCTTKSDLSLDESSVRPNPTLALTRAMYDQIRP